MHGWSADEMTEVHHPSGYRFCLILMIVSAVVIFLLPLPMLGLKALPSLLLLAAVFLLPLLACNIGVEGYPLFKWHFHGSPREMEAEQTRLRADDIPDRPTDT